MVQRKSFINNKSQLILREIYLLHFDIRRPLTDLAYLDSDLAQSNEKG